MKAAVVRDCIALVALCLIFGGCVPLFGIAVACVVLGSILLALTLAGGRARREK